MTCFELGGVVAGKRMRIEWMRLVDDESALTGSLKSGVYLFVVTATLHCAVAKGKCMSL